MKRNALSMQTGSDPQQLIRTLQSGGVAIFATDTVYGVGCRIDSEPATKRLYDAKARDYQHPVPILLADQEDLNHFVKTVPGGVVRLISQFWPGALTIILPVKEGVLLPYFVLQGQASFRVPNNDTLRSVIRAVGVPVVGTSANFHGKPAVYTGSALDPAFIKLVDYIFIDQDGSGKESTVIAMKDDRIAIIREGAITKSQLQI